MNQRSYLRSLALLSVAALTFFGCKPSAPTLEKATGSVTLDGKAVEGAIVTFIYDDGKSSQGLTDKSGKFELTSAEGNGAYAGNATVTVSKIGSTASAMPNPADVAASGSGEVNVKRDYLLPEKYAAMNTTDLRYEDKAGSSNDFPIVLESDTPAPNATGDGSTPATDTPATDTPATDTPATDTPATDTPASDTPATDTPSSDTPDSAETPAEASETPAATDSAPSTEAPATAPTP